ncbi:MMPL family transporter [Fulvivirgaceae bacterium BMA12]|uniref:MMPL family transporter n=1 Tax=Agaribacillus aureus TaxID=3051825 RepID=A0ABT8LDJ3_9BACT|nr:MMPL family transporter [Fulvivirgaceae bacterium BMA12]
MEKLKRMSGQFGIAWAKWVIKRRWIVLILSILTFLAMGFGMSKLAFDGDYRVFFSKDNPQLQAYETFQRKYTQDDNVLIVVEPKDGKTFSKESLAAIEQLTTDSWQTPFSSRVDAITNFQHTYAVGDELYVEDLADNVGERNPDEIQKIKKIALSEPLLVNRLLNEKGTVSAVNITVKLPGEAITEGPEVTAYVREMVAKFEEAHPNLKTHLSGMIMLNSAFFEASAQDSSTLIPLMFLAIVLTIFLATRTISGTFSALLIIIFSIAAGMGFAGHLGIKLTPPSGAAPIIIMTLAVADSIHILITLMQGMRRGLPKREALIESLRVNFMPVFITSLTTVIGFLSMNTSEVPPFRDLGNITAVGMIAAFLFSVTALPAMMAILPVRVKVKEATVARSNKFFESIADLVIARRMPVLITSLVIIFGFGYLAFQNQLNDEFIKYFDSKISFRQDTDFISDNLTGIYNVEFSLGSGEPGGINNPGYLQKLQDFERWLEQQSEVIHVNSYAEVARQVNQSMHGDSLQYYAMPTNREEAAQYLLLYEMSLPFGLDLNNQINVDKSESRLTATIKNISTLEMVAFAKRAEEWLRSNTPANMHTLGISPTMMFAYLSGRQVLSMVTGTGLAIVLITIVLIFALRSLKYGLMSIVPNITPIAVGFGIWALLEGSINVGVSIVFGMTLGIIVDDTIHFLSKYLLARREHGYSVADAIKYAFTTVGRALLVTTIVLVSGFAILAQSSFGMNSGMAKMTSIIIVVALIIDFLLLPALLLVFTPEDKEEKLQAQPVASTE